MTVPRGQTPERKAYMKAWRAANPRDRRAYKAAYDAANREKNAAYRAANAERRAEQKREWYAANRERILRKARERYRAKRKELADYGRQHYAANAEQYKSNAARRKAKVRGAEGSHTLEEWQAKCAEFDHCCAYCGEEKRLTRDHKIPVSKGGSDYINNIVPACSSCNSKKRARLPEDFTNHQRVGGPGGDDVEGRR